MYCIKLGMIECACNASTQVAKQENYHEFESSLGYSVRLFQTNERMKIVPILMTGQVR